MTHTALLKQFNELAAKATPGKWKVSATAQKQSNYGKYKVGLHRGEGMKFESVTITADAPERALQIAHDAAQYTDLLTVANAQQADIAELVACLRELKTGDCFCGFGIGHPLFPDHTNDCVKARALLERIGHE